MVGTSVYRVIAGELKLEPLLLDRSLELKNELDELASELVPEVDCELELESSCSVSSTLSVSAISSTLNVSAISSTLSVSVATDLLALTESVLLGERPP